MLGVEHKENDKADSRTDQAGGACLGVRTAPARRGSFVWFVDDLVGALGQGGQEGGGVEGLVVVHGVTVLEAPDVHLG